MPLVKRNVKRGAVAFFILIFALLALWCIGFNRGLTPLPKPPDGVRLQPLRPPLMLNDVKSDNAAFYYLKTSGRLGNYKQSEGSRLQVTAPLANNAPEDTKDIKQTLTDCRDALDLTRKASQMSFCQMPWIDPTNSPSILSSMRQSAHLLVADGKMAEQSGDFDRALDDYLVVIKVGRDCKVGGALLTRLLGESICNTGRQAVRAWTLRQATTPQAIRDLMTKLNLIGEEEMPYGETLRYELIYSKQQFEQMVLSRLGPWQRIVVGRQATFACSDAFFGELIQNAEKPFWESEAKTIQEKWRLSDAPTLQLILNRPIPRTMLWMMLPAFEQAQYRVIRGELDAEATVIVCALRAYTLTNGHPPEQLSELVPGLLPAIPIDPYDGKPLRYRREGKNWVVWSVGSDKKDDNAQWHEFKYRGRGDNREGGDIYFKSTEPEDDLAFYKAGLVRSKSARASTQ